MSVTVTHGHMIVICMLHSWLPTSRVTGRASSKIVSLGHVLLNNWELPILIVVVRLGLLVQIKNDARKYTKIIRTTKERERFRLCLILFVACYLHFEV